MINPQKEIKEIKATHGLSDTEIARRAGVHQATITRIRRGQSGALLRTALRISALKKALTEQD